MAVPVEWYELELCRAFHCLPSDLADEDSDKLALMWLMIQTERFEQFLEGKRAEQRAK